MASNESEKGGGYGYVIDALQAPARGEVLKHEVIHRVLLHPTLAGQGLAILRHLVGISHTLLATILNTALQQQARVELLRGRKLNTGGNGDLRFLFGSLGYVEKLISMSANALEPICELATIDFASRHEVGGWYVWGKDRASIGEGEEPQADYDALIDTLGRKYGRTFSGYHVTVHGSYANGLRAAWHAYRAIEDEGAKRALLSLCMQPLHHTEQSAPYTDSIVDPIESILHNAALAQSDPETAKRLFAQERQVLDIEAKSLVAHTEESVLGFFPPEQRATLAPIRRLRAITALLTKQASVFEAGRVVHLTHAALRGADAPNGVFLRLYTEGIGRPGVDLNSAFLNAIKNDGELGCRDFPETWWVELLTLELLRQAVINKEGRKLSCPFKGYTRLHRLGDILGERHCGADCPFRAFIDETRQWSNLVADTPYCER